MTVYMENTEYKVKYVESKANLKRIIIRWLIEYGRPSVISLFLDLAYTDSPSNYAFITLSY